MRLSLRSIIFAAIGIIGTMGTGAVPQASAQENMRDSATVLMYHRFGESRYPSTNISLEQFDAHIAHLSSGAYNVCLLYTSPSPRD